MSSCFPRIPKPAGRAPVQITWLVLATASLWPAEGYSAELPVPQPSETQKICSEAGQGFVRIAGTDTCLRIGGELYAQASKGVGKELGFTTSYDALGRPAADVRLARIADEFTGLSSHGEIVVETQSATELGALTTQIEIRGTMNGADLTQATVSVAGINLGFRSSFFDVGSGYNESAGLSSDRSTTVLAYSAALRDDLTVTLSAEDGTLRRFNDGIWAQYAGQRAPDLVGAVDWDPDPYRGWIHAAAALHPIRDIRAGTDKEFGWAGIVAAGRYFRYKGDAWGRLLMTGAVSRGATDYLGIPANTPDYIRESSGALAVTRGVSGLVSYQHNWRPTLRSAATASFYRTKTEASAIDWNSKGFWLTLGSEYNLVPGLALGLDATYYVDTVWASPGEDDSATARSLVAISYVRRRF